MKDFQDYINRDNALKALGNENWDLEDALEFSLSSWGINHNTKREDPINASTINMTGIQILECFDISQCNLRIFF